MGLFNRSRRQRDEPEAEADATELAELETDEAPLEGPATWYRATHLSFLPAGDDVLVHDPERESPVALAAFELDLLAQCTYFASIEEHAAAAARRTGLPADGVTQRLYELVGRGLLVSQQDIVDRARDASAAEPETQLPLDRVGIVTSDRPEKLAACLRSFRERYGESVELVVFDDSADTSTRDENHRVAAVAGAGGPVSYAGEKEKRQFVAELAARSGIDEEVIGAAVADFDGCTFHCGANRNAVLLDAAGGAVVMVDDDTTSRVTRAAEALDGLRLSSVFDPWSVSFFTRVEDALKAASWQEVDILAAHRMLLGRSPAACVFRPTVSGAASSAGDRHGVAVELNQADSGMISAFSHGRGRIVATAAGVAGDSGMGVPTYSLALRDSARERLLENYESHRATRGVHRGADIVTISNSPVFMGAHVGLDVRDTIPPFPPLFRNSDGVFGALLRTSAPESYVTFLPWLVEHAPPETRPADFEKIVRSVSRVRANDIIRNLAIMYEPAPGVNDPRKRLQAIGRYLIALGEMPAADFDSLVRSEIASIVGRRLERLTRAVADYDGRPEAWGEDCTRVINEGIRAVTEDELVVADVPGPTVEQRHRRFQRVIHRFGRVIEAWSALLGAARELRVARPVRS